jgi:hypothetical protein
MTSPDTNLILIDGSSSHWRRRLGALQWIVLEELALRAVPTESGWGVPVGVREVGAALAVTKNTAARATAALRSAGIVVPARIERDHGLSRSGYLLRLPEGVTLRTTRPLDQDRALPQRSSQWCEQAHNGNSVQSALFAEEGCSMVPRRVNAEVVR